jgi:hypothetical protein
LKPPLERKKETLSSFEFQLNHLSKEGGTKEIAADAGE